MTEAFSFWIDRIPTPIGELALVADEAGALRAVDWTDDTDRTERLLQLHYGSHLVIGPRRNPHGLSTALRAYFAGELTIINQLPVATGGTAFQCAVWEELRKIPCGTTISYGTLAARMGKPAAVRAVGLANGANPVGIVVPCHRVIGANGALTGYGGGLTRKRWLLQHEGVYTDLFSEKH